MKVRCGFVSNSSSSSFVMIGCPVTDDIKKLVIPEFNEDDEDYYEKWDKWRDESDCLYVERDDCEYIVGKQIASFDCDYLEDGEVSISDIDRISTELSEKYSIPKDKFKLMYGTYPC